MDAPFLDSDHISRLERLQAEARSAAERRRAKLLLLYHAGHSSTEVAAAVGLSASQVRYWRREFDHRGLEIFKSLVADGDAADGDAAAAPEQPEPAPAELSGPGVLPDDALAEAGRKVLRYHYEEFLRREAGTRLGEDIEELHKMRVATRRMRAAFGVFAPYFRARQIQAHLDGLRQAGRALGRVRDRDVFLEKTQAYLDTLPDDEQRGLDPLLQAWAKERKQARKRLLKLLGSKGHRRFRRDFQGFLDTPGAGSRKGGRRRKPTKTAAALVPDLVRERLNAVNAHDSIVAAANFEQLHTLRIEFKQLRYTLEFFQEILGPEAAAVIEKLKAIQDHLGDLNDADVACQSLTQFISQWDRLQAEKPLNKRLSPQPLADYIAHNYGVRHRLMAEFPGVWRKFQRPAFEKQLTAALTGSQE